MADEPKAEAKADGDAIVVVYVNEFTEASAKKFHESFREAREAEQELVPVYIDSYGGYVDSLMSMYDAIASYPGKVATISIGKAMSCGLFLLSFGNAGLRYAAPNSRLMLHHLVVGAFGKVQDIVNDANENKRLQEHVFRLMSEKCGQSPEYFLQQLKERGNVDWYMTPQEAMQFRIIDQIKCPFVKTKVTTKLTLE
jgi:ATP-dependent Clp protease protease subunit